MAREASEIVIVCADDGREWAMFIQRKLSSQEYNIRTETEDFSRVRLPLTGFKVQVLLLSPQLLEGAIRSSDCDFAQFDKSSTVIILLGVDILDLRSHLGPSSESVLQCQHETIHEEDPGKSLASALVQIIRVYERDELLEEDPFDEEKEDSIYQYPPSPRQINQIYKVIPPTDGTSSEALILLDRQTDGDVVVNLQTQTSTKVTAKLLEKVVYSVKLHEGTSGTVVMKVSCGEQVIGEDSIKVQSKLNQLRSLLQDITNPISLMCQALGLDTDSSEALDIALSKQIRKQWSSQTMQIFQIFEANIAEETNHEWPTLPHFIAEFNLVKTCTELLKFPSTALVMACCMENCNGDYPCNIAESKGYHHLAELLIKVVEEHNPESGVVPDIPPPAPHMMPSHYVNQEHHYEGELDTESPYMDMSGLMKDLQMQVERPMPCSRTKSKDPTRMQRSVSDGGAKSRISFMNPDYSLRPVSEGSADELSSSPESLTDFKKVTSPPPIVPKKEVPHTPPKPKLLSKPDLPLSSSFGPSSSKPETSSKPQTLPRTVSTPPRKSSGDTPAQSAREQNRHSDSAVESSQEDPEVSSRVDPRGTPVCSPTAADIEDAKRVAELFGNIQARSRSESEPSARGSTYSEDFTQMSDDEETRPKGGSLIGDAYQTQSDPPLRVKTARSRISSFLKRLGKKKQTSDPSIQKQDKNKKKTVFYGRQGRGSDPGLPGKMSLPLVLEPQCGRDSGSYSEEEDGSTDAENMAYRKRLSKQSNSGKKMSLKRAKSVRVSRAMNEVISDAPRLPPQSTSRSRFLSASSAT